MNLVIQPKRVGSFLQVAGNQDISVQPSEMDQLAMQAEEARRKQQLDIGLSGHIRRVWDEAYKHKQPHHRAMVDALRRRKGEYDAATLAEIKRSGTTAIFMRISDIKCRAAEAWIKDILDTNSRCWDIRPTSEPQLSPDQEMAMLNQAQMLIQSGQFDPQTAADLLKQAKAKIKETLKQQARETCEKMANHIQDQLEEGDFEIALDEFITDITTFKAAFIEGPVLRRQMTLEWDEQGNPSITPTIVRTVNRISPFDVYPSPHAKTVNDGDICIIKKFTPSDIYAMQGMPGNKDEAIRQVLDLWPNGLINWLEMFHGDREIIEGNYNYLNSTPNYFEVLQYRGLVQGKYLLEWGMDESRVKDRLQYYAVEALMIGNYVIRCVFTPDPLGRKNLYKASAVNIPGSFWGQSVVDLVSDCEDMCNYAARALADNMSLASGPQVALDSSAMPTGETLEQIYPWKIWQIIQGPNGTGNIPIQFFQPTLNAGELMGVYDKFSLYADQISGIPAYTYGAPTGQGAAGTASGLNMLMGAASKGIKNIIKNIEKAINEMIEYFYTHNMLFADDPSIKGDAKVVAMGSSALMQKETLQMRKQEFLQFTNNPIDMQIMGIEGRANLLREVAKPLEMQDEIVPSKDELRNRMQMQQGMPPPGGGPQPEQSAPANPDGSPQGISHANSQAIAA